MKNSKITSTFILLFLFLASVQTMAQEEKKLISANSFNLIIPQGKLADTYNLGLGIYANIDYNFSKHLAARFDLGWNSLSGPEAIDSLGFTEKPRMNLWEFTAGLKASVSIVYVEVRGGYFTGVNSWGFVPAVGLRIGRFDLQGNYTFAGDNEWFTARIGFYWGN
ncbi:MAG: hypothetical protein L3J66_08075 [Bacteroidales bacterium]|nr:hypothetical protein [Bacteroidales bacterium]